MLDIGRTGLSMGRTSRRQAHPVRRILLSGTAALLGLQAGTLLALKVVDTQRKKRTPPQGFPHLPPTEARVSQNQVTIYSYGSELYNAMLDAIDAATDSIYFETYIWKGDEVGNRFKERLIAKARSGVAVYVIFDSFGNLVVPPAFKAFPEEVHTLEYRAIERPWQVVDPRRYSLDHRKLLVVDGQTAFMGGYNIGSLYETEWRDTHLRIEGPATAELAQSFVNFWNRERSSGDRITTVHRQRFDPAISMWSNDAMQLAFPIRDMYIRAIHRAQHHVLLTNSYFVPDHMLLNALKEAAGRGVDVQVLLPWMSNHVAADWAARGYFTDCLRAGIRIFGYQHAMIHAKTCTIDGQWSTIGTANMDRLSSVGNYEINMEIYSEELAHRMEELFACDRGNAFELTLDEWDKRPWYDWLSERILAPLRVMV
jgi:cardiolipin synthase A/B